MHTLTHPHTGRTVQVPEQDAPRWLAVGWLDTAADAAPDLEDETPTPDPAADAAPIDPKD
ncbi:MAG: hypothetical protein IPJ61_17605 [Tessaracoccus sp.]|uniref:hypothetical protein n=1 Tax=Tessaracoccus sp. TaxID=1971211 RepID=UPI001EBF53EF|nr:hypothetical protein [Tessaracoccus sp.]MBK7822821.1 hypothetical protein [Tessaracoccus sp.]